MKRNLLAFTMIALSMVVVSCKNSVSEDIAGGYEPQGEGTMKVVRLNFNEEQVSMSQDQTPMTRGDGDVKTYYGINVYQQTDKGNEKYAYGLFDKTDNMNLTLEEGNKYTIECMEIRNSEDTVLHKGNKFYYPFFRNNEPGEITNKFVNSTTINNDVMTNGIFSTSEKDTTRFPRVYTFYGTLENFNPSESDEANIDLRRAVFGLRFKITPPKDGTAVLRYLNDYYITIKAGDEPYDHQSIYTFHKIKQSCKEGYKGSIAPGITWTYSNGKIVVDSLRINIARNTITTVNIGFSGASPTGITFNEENTAFENSETSYTVGNK